MFTLKSQFTPSGDQPLAIEKLTCAVRSGKKHNILLGVTGSGKTFTIANVIERVQKPTLVIAPNKTLAAQLTQEFRAFFPDNAVEYFVSYYDYYRPEAYNPGTDTFIEKETQINDEIDRLRHATTASLFSRKDVIVVASVSCIYGLGLPDFYRESTLSMTVGGKIDRDDFIKKLIDLYYTRSDVINRGTFRVRGDVIDVCPIGSETMTRFIFADDCVRSIDDYDVTTRQHVRSYVSMLIYPAKHFIAPQNIIDNACVSIEQELKERVDFFEKNGRLLEAQRIQMRTRQDVEMIREIGYCSGIENYSRYMTSREPGAVPYTLLDYFPKDFLMVVDESHVTVPQLRAMWEGDVARKRNLVEHGFRLPSAYDNRPLKFDEFVTHIDTVIYTSATPGKYEMERVTDCDNGDSNAGGVVEQIIRPTGVVDPTLIVRPTIGQVKDVINEVHNVISHGERVLITTLTKKQAEDLSVHLCEQKIKTAYIHSGVETLQRIRILDDLRAGVVDVLVGVNLLREGLDLPEVSLVAILDADKEGFLRSTTSLIQTIGRAARHLSGRVILYADTITGSLKNALDETQRRRRIQMEYNEKHGIIPSSTTRSRVSITNKGQVDTVDRSFKEEKVTKVFKTKTSLEKHIIFLEKEMNIAAKNLAFEHAAMIRDEIASLKKMTIM